MPNEEDWAQRRQRAARCKIHGLHYDPRLTSGCTLCRKEGLAGEPRQKPQLLLMLLSLLGVAVILYRMFGPGLPVRADSETVAVPPEPMTAAASSRLDPEPYRTPIEAVEKALFMSSAVNLPEMSDQIVNALGQLRRDLDDSHESVDAVASLDEISAPLAEEELSLERLAGLRQEWLRLRSRTFLNAPWFVVAARVTAGFDRGALMTYRAAAADLFALLGEGADRARELATPTTPNLVDPKELARNQETWRSFRSEWRQRIVDLRRQLPARPTASADPQVLLATQRLEQAFAQTSTLAAGDLPEQARLDAAFDAAEEARRSFDDLLVQ